MIETPFVHRVSEPEALLLVRQVVAGTPESALVVPGLPVEEVVYWLALVDEHDIAEHAAVIGAGWLDAPALRAECRRVITLRRPRVVSFWLPFDGDADGGLELVDVFGKRASVRGFGGLLAARRGRDPNAQSGRIQLDGARVDVELEREGLLWKCSAAAVRS